MAAKPERYPDLARAAKAAQQNAYAPYSKFQVGAAVLARSGKIYSACNVENASYGLSLCAERAAIAKAVSEGEKGFLAIAVIARGSSPVSPCGACRQWIYEFSPQAEVLMLSEKGRPLLKKIGELLPLGFGRRNLE